MKEMRVQKRRAFTSTPTFFPVLPLIDSRQRLAGGTLCQLFNRRLHEINEGRYRLPKDDPSYVAWDEKLKIKPNTVYLTCNAPEVDEYVRQQLPEHISTVKAEPN